MIKNKRDFSAKIGDKWIGNGISYSAYRDGETPDNDITAKHHILEDMQILMQRWQLIRIYGADEQAERILQVIAENKLPIKVMQGAWLDAHRTVDENKDQIDKVIELANTYSDIIIAVNVGNEILVDWAHHRIDDVDIVIRKIRRVRDNITQPVSVSDDYNFWNKPEAKLIAAELDFISLHAYAFWNNQPLDFAMKWTVDIYNSIREMYPEFTVTYSETGWPTDRIFGDGSHEGNLIGVAGEQEQDHYFHEYNDWVSENNIISFYFSSFDESWKGGFDGINPEAKAEKHWGLFNSDRTPKLALQDTKEPQALASV